MIGQGLAMCAGACAALASTCAKLAMAVESSQGLCHALLLKLDQLGDQSSQHDICDSVILYIRFLFFGLIFLFNALMWTLFVKSLQKCNTSIEASVTNAGTNFFCTAIIGWMFFNEKLSLMWWFGASMIVLGLLLIQRGSVDQTKNKLKES